MLTISLAEAVPLVMSVLTASPSPSPEIRVVVETTRSGWDPASLVSIGATIVLAVVAALTLIANRRLVKETQRMADASQQSAAAAGDEVAAAREEVAASRAMIEEVRKDREISALPYLTWSIRKWPPSGTTSEVQEFAVANFGRGPAINCRFVSVQDGQRRQSLRFDLSAQEAGQLVAYVHRESLHDPGAILGDRDQLTIYHALFCYDQFGNMYRFRIGEQKPDTWTEGDEAPEWAKWYKNLPPGIPDIPPDATGLAVERRPEDEPVMDIVSEIETGVAEVQVQVSVRNAAGGIARRVIAGAVSRAGLERTGLETVAVMAPGDGWAAMGWMTFPMEQFAPGWGQMTPNDRAAFDLYESCIFWVQYSNKFGEVFRLKQVGKKQFPTAERIG